MTTEEQKTILIVDDEETLTWSMSKNLSLNKRYKVICANSAEEALEILQKTGGVDLIVSDIKMQGKDGLQLLSEVKAKYPKVGFVIMTAYGSTEKRQEALEKGAIRYIEKPFMMNQVKEIINEVLSEMERLFLPLDENLKQEVKNNPKIQSLLANICDQEPKLISIKLAAQDGETISHAGSKTSHECFKIDHAVKIVSRVQAVSEKLNRGKLKEIVMSTDKYNIILHSLAESPFLLYTVFDKTLVMGKAILLINNLENQIKNLGV